MRTMIPMRRWTGSNLDGRRRSHQRRGKTNVALRWVVRLPASKRTVSSPPHRHAQLPKMNHRGREKGSRIRKKMSSISYSGEFPQSANITATRLPTNIPMAIPRKPSVFHFSFQDRRVSFLWNPDPSSLPLISPPTSPPIDPYQIVSANDGSREKNVITSRLNNTPMIIPVRHHSVILVLTKASQEVF
jgi:hypothetical protein